MKPEPILENETNNISSLMSKGYIPAISMATLSGNSVKTISLGHSDIETKETVNAETRFWACSLSKPVFAYLVLKLIKEGELPPNFLNDPLSWDDVLGPENKAIKLTPRQILSHQTGLPNRFGIKPNFKFSPENGFLYSGMGFYYLQKVIEKKTGKKLNELASENIFKPLNMTKSSFILPDDLSLTTSGHTVALEPHPLPREPINSGNAAGSLYTTAEDFAAFLNACMINEEFSILFTPQIHDMQKKDLEAIDKKVDEDTLKTIDWGLGFALQKNDKNEPVVAFHWGEGPGVRNFFAINLEHKTGIVFLTNSANGLSIIEDLSKDAVGNIEPIIKFLSTKYEFSSIHSPEWEGFHDNLIKGLEAEKAKHYPDAIKYYQLAAQYSSLATPELNYRILKAEVLNVQNINEEKKLQSPESWVGEYGPLKMTCRGSTLYIDDGAPNSPRKLEQIDDQTFLDGKYILKFQLNDKQKKLNCYFPNKPSCSFSAAPAISSQKPPTANQLNKWFRDDISHHLLFSAPKNNARDSTKKHYSADDISISYSKKK